MRDVAERSHSRPVRVVFVCLGNICRSPIAERVAERAAADAGMTGVEFSSAGTISEEYDDPMDRRAVAVLKEHGYRYADHRARRITAAQIESADLVVAMENVHLRAFGACSRSEQGAPAHRLRSCGCARVQACPTLVWVRRRLLRHSHRNRSRHARAARSHPQPPKEPSCRNPTDFGFDLSEQ